MNENEIQTEPSKEEKALESEPESGEATENEAVETATGSASEPEVDPAEESPETTAPAPTDGDDYRERAQRDLAELKTIDPETAVYRHLGEMPGALRFAELRELGLSVEEAYYAVRGAARQSAVPDRGGREHLHGSVPGRAATGGIGMTVGEIEAARRLFPHLPDREIASLFRRVNENRNQ